MNYFDLHILRDVDYFEVQKQILDFTISENSLMELHKFNEKFELPHHAWMKFKIKIVLKVSKKYIDIKNS